VKFDIKYLNTDLEIRSKEDISQLIKQFDRDVLVLYYEQSRDEYFASLEINHEVSDANTTAEYFCNLVDRLSPDFRIIWNKCDCKTLDIGYESGNCSNYYRSELTSQTVQRIAELGMSIVITIYPLSSKNSS
jgi:hypothetical protein